MSLFKPLLKVSLPVLVIAAGALGARRLIEMRPESELSAPQSVSPGVGFTLARSTTVQLTVEAHGTVVPRTESAVIAEVAGRVVAVSPALSSGGFFDAGEVLVRLDPRDFELLAVQAELELATARRVLAEVEADAEVARSDWEQLGSGLGSPLVLHEPQLAEAVASVAAAEAGLEHARRDIERCALRAPYDGRVRSERVDVGQYVGRGSELASIYAVSSAEVRLPLADSELAFLDLPLAFRDARSAVSGPPVSLHARFAGREHTWQGRVVRTEGELDQQSRMLIAVAEVQDPYGREQDNDRPPLAVGMFVGAEIQGRKVQEAFILPRRALRKSAEVLVVDDEDRLRVRQVEVLRAERERLIVTSGLADGERVVVTPLAFVVEGLRVHPVEESSP